jgi:hypothetical protein
MYHFLPNLGKVLYTISASTSVDVEEWLPYYMNYKTWIWIGAWIYSLFDYNHWEQLSTGSSLNQLGPCQLPLLPVPISVTSTAHCWSALRAVLENWRQMINTVCDIVILSYRMCQEMMPHEINMWHIAAEFMPGLLSNDHVKHHVAVCFELKERTLNSVNFISTKISGDES